MFSTRYAEEKNTLPFEYGLCKVWFFSFAPLSILSVAHYKQNKWKIQLSDKFSCFPYRFWMHSFNSTHRTDQLHDSHVHLEKTQSKKRRQAPLKASSAEPYVYYTRSIFLIVTAIGEGLGW